jgi:ubiquinone/menaquinone biosynthesis C-methylase UbiE
MDQTIVDFYSKYDEMNRLVDRHSLERVRTEEIIGRCLDKPGLRILDIGGASGIYSFWLAEMGHVVDLIDLTPKHIEQALEAQRTKGSKLNSARVGDACSLPFEDKSYDVALLMGPLYHLQEREQRIRALSEAKRVLVRGGTIVVAAISKYASLFDGYLKNLVADKAFCEIMREDIRSGRHMNQEEDPRYFTKAYFHHASELREEMEAAGIGSCRVVAVEGFGLCVPGIEGKMDDIGFKTRILDDLRQLEADPTIIGISPHYLGIGVNE